MGIQADWNLAELEKVNDDPFDTMILTTGLTVDLTGGEEAVYDGLRQTLRIEAELFNHDITCELKDGGQDCLTCDLYTTDREERRAPLCMLGRDQRKLEQRCSALTAERVRPYAALGESYLPEASMAAPYGRLLRA